MLQSIFNLFTAHSDECSEELRSDRYLKFDEVHVISAKDEISIDKVKESIRRTMDKYAEAEIDKELEGRSKKQVEKKARIQKDFG